MKVRPGRLLAIFLVTGWVVLFSSHIWRSYSSSATAADVRLSAPASVDLTQKGVFYRGSRIGYIREQMTPIQEGVQVEQEGRFTLNVMGQRRSLDIAGSAVLGKDGALRQFTYRLKTASGRHAFETQVSGRVDGIELHLRVRSGEKQRSERRTLRKPIVLPINLYYSLAAQGLEPGKSYRLRLFDPMTLTDADAQITVLEREIVRWGGHQEEAFRLRSRFAGLSTTAWVSATGQVLKEQTPLGWTLIKEEPGSGLQARVSGRVPEMVASSAIPAHGYVASPETLRRARLRLNRFPPLRKDALGGRQGVEGNEVLIEVEPLPPERKEELSPRELQGYLSSDAFIQADAPEIRELADRLTEDLPRLEAARRLSDWVYNHLNKTPTLSIPSATEVLEQRAGDCNEHTVLFTALARAARIPTRVCTGLAYSRGQFYYHAWPEVWLGSWVAIDPTFGQFPADPLHLRLLTGGLEQQYEVLRLMGRGASIEILEAQ